MSSPDTWMSWALQPGELFIRLAMRRMRSTCCQFSHMIRCGGVVRRSVFDDETRLDERNSF